MNEIVSLLESLMAQAAEIADELSDEEMAQVLTIFQQAIELVQLQEAPIETPVPEVSAAQYPSSNINGFKFDPKTQKLLIQFHGPYPNAAGPIYQYENVPEFLFKILERGAVGPKTSGQNRYHRWIKGVTPSLGAAVNALIKAGGFQFTRLT